MPSINQNPAAPKTRKIAIPTPPSALLRARQARSVMPQSATGVNAQIIDNFQAASHSRNSPNKPAHGPALPPRHRQGRSLWPTITGSALGYIYATTVGIVVHEALGHGFLGLTAVVRCPHGLQYWTHAIQHAAQGSAPESIRHHYWQADWVDNMLLHGPILGTARQLTAIDGYVAAPNDTAWAWNRLDDQALQRLLKGFAANHTGYFEKSLGFISSPSVDEINMTRLGRRIGRTAAEVWIDIAGSVPGFALVCGAWEVAQKAHKNYPATAAIAASFGNALHTFNVIGMRGDMTNVASMLTTQRVPRTLLAMAFVLGAAQLPFIIDSASRARRDAENRREHAAPENRTVPSPLDVTHAVLLGAQKILFMTAISSLCIEPGKPFSGHIAFALPTIAALGLTSAWIDGERGRQRAAREAPRNFTAAR